MELTRLRIVLALLLLLSALPISAQTATQQSALPSATLLRALSSHWTISTIFSITGSGPAISLRSPNSKPAGALAPAPTWVRGVPKMPIVHLPRLFFCVVLAFTNFPGSRRKSAFRVNSGGQQVKQWFPAANEAG